MEVNMNKLKKFELHNGDCLEVMKGIEDKSIDLILCDPPYGTTSCRWDSIINLEKMWEQYNRIIKDNGVIVLFSAQPFTTKLINSNIKSYKYSWYWIKNTVTGFAFAKYQPMRKVEDINVFYKKATSYNPQGLVKLEKSKASNRKVEKDSVYDKSLNNRYVQEYTNYPNNVLNFNKENKCIHPTQKPVDLLEYLIKTYTKEGDTVLDNCYGSGSTGVACANTNRKFIGIELDEEYFKSGGDRVRKAYM
jgi:DNA modification methylase